MSAKEIASILHGFLLIIKFDEKFKDHFENSHEAFWKSFYAAIVVAPLQVIYEWGLYISLDEKPNLTRAIPIEVLEYTILWVLFPLVMTYITKVINREEQYFRYIVTYNWLQMCISIIIMPLIILSVFNFLPISASTFLETMVFLLFVTYNIFIVKIALKLQTGPSFSIVLIDVLLTLLVTQIILSIL